MKKMFAFMTVVLLAMAFIPSCGSGKYFTNFQGRRVYVSDKYADAYSRGDEFANSGQYDLAIVEYTKAIELDPKVAEAYNNRGRAYIHKGQYDQAIADCNKALEIDPGHTYAYFHRGYAYAMKGQYNLAIADFTKVIELDPKYANIANTYYGRGVAYCAKGQFDLAISDLNNAKKLDPNLKGVDESIAQCTGKQKKVVPKSLTR